MSSVDANMILRHAAIKTRMCQDHTFSRSPFPAGWLKRLFALFKKNLDKYKKSDKNFHILLRSLSIERDRLVQSGQAKLPGKALDRNAPGMGDNIYLHWMADFAILQDLCQKGGRLGQRRR